MSLKPDVGVDGNSAVVSESVVKDLSPTTLPFGQLGSILGSNFAQILRIENPLEALVASTAFGTIGLNLGQAIEASAGEALSLKAFGDFHLDLASAGLGAISSYYAAQLVAELGLGEFETALVNSQTGAVIGQIAENIVRYGPEAWAQGLGSSGLYLRAGASFLGSYLAQEITNFNTVDRQIGASIGSAVGALLVTEVFFKGGAILGGPVGALIGAFVGYIAGGVIGSIFNWEGKPSAAGEVYWEREAQQFAGRFVWEKNDGPADAATQLAQGVAETLNGLIEGAGARVIDPTGIRLGHVGMRKGNWKYWDEAGPLFGAEYDEPNHLLIDAAAVGFSQLVPRLAGGDVYVKRTLAAHLGFLSEGDAVQDENGLFQTTLDTSGNATPPSIETVFNNLVGVFKGNGGRRREQRTRFDAAAVLGDLSVAQDYGRYTQDFAAINALFAAAPESAFAAGWTITFARALELGLHKRAYTDWIGGWGAFLDETADGAIDGFAFMPVNLEFELDAETNERLFGFFDADGSWLGTLGDTIDTSSKTSITGTAGADLIALARENWSETLGSGETVERSGWRVGDTPALTIDGAALTQEAREVSVAALIDGGDGDDVIQGGDLGNDLLGGAGNDLLIGGALDDWLIGGDGADTLFAGDITGVDFAPLADLPDGTAPGGGALTAQQLAALATLDQVLRARSGNGDYLDGGEGDDALFGGIGSEWIFGGAGADSLYGGRGGDVLDGGTGDDVARGGDGSDHYVFRVGMGADVVEDRPENLPAQVMGKDGLAQRVADINAGVIARNWAGDGSYSVNGSVAGGDDAIVFGDGIALSDLQISRTGEMDLTITRMIQEGELRTPSADRLTIANWFDTAQRVEWLRFADGQEVRIGDLSTFVIGSEVGEQLIGTNSADWLSGGGGDDELRALRGDDFVFGGRGNDFATGDADSDFVFGGDGNDDVRGNSGRDSVYGDAGEDVVDGGDGNDLLAGGRGDDTLVTGAGDDVIRYARGDGRDTVLDHRSGTWELVYQATKDANGFYTGGNYTNGYTLAGGTVAKAGVTYFDGAKWNGLFDWNDDIGELRRYIEPAAGTAVSKNAGVDTLEFAPGIDIQDLLLRTIGDDLEIHVGDVDAPTGFSGVDDVITIKDWTRSGVTKSIEKFAFAATGEHSVTAMGVVGAAATDGDDALSGGAGADWITGGGGNDDLSGLGGVDILAGNAGNDVLRGGAHDDVLYGGAGRDLLMGGVGRDQLYGGEGDDLASYADAIAAVRANLARPNVNTGDALGDVFADIEGLEGSDFNDTLVGDAFDNTMIGGIGDDILIGGEGEDTYIISNEERGAVPQNISGADTIVDGGIPLFTETGALAAGFSVDWTTTSRVETEWVVEWYDDDGFFLPEPREYPVDRTYYSHMGVVTWDKTGQEVAQISSGDTLDPAVPDVDRSIVTSYLVDVLDFGPNQGTIIIGANWDDNASDTLEFETAASLSDLEFARVGDDVTLTHLTGEVRLRGQARHHAVEDLVLADGLVADLTTLRLDNTGTGEADMLAGSAGADALNGGGGDDLLSGGRGGDDTLAGGDGDDVLEGGVGADVLDGGSDRQSAFLSEPQGTERPQDAGQWGDTIRYVGSATGVLIDLASGTASGGHAEGDTIINIEHVAGSRFNDVLRGDSRENRLVGLDGDDLLEGRGGADSLDGGAGNDTLQGGAGDDELAGGDGADTLHGGDGVDVLSGDAGNDIVLGEAGEDVLFGGDGADQLVGGAANDTLDGGAGDDLLYGDAGNDMIIGGEGADRLIGGDGLDVLMGGAAADILEGGLGDDVYVFGAADGADEIIDASGLNEIQLGEARAEDIWLSRVGDDLRIGIGADRAILVRDAYVSTAGFELIADGQALRFTPDSQLIAAMTALGANGPTDELSAGQSASLAVWRELYWRPSEDGGAVASTEPNASPKVSIALLSSRSLSEGAGGGASFTFRINLSQPAAADIDVLLALGGDVDVADFSVAPERVTILAGQTYADVTFTAAADVAPEFDEALSVNVVSSADYVLGANPTARAVIVNDDLPTATISLLSSSDVDEGTNPGVGAAFTFRVTLDGPTLQQVVIPLSLLGEVDAQDFEGVPASVTVAAGESFAEFTLRANADAFAERAEGFSLALGAGQGFLIGAQASASARLLNDDLPVASIVATSETQALEGTAPGVGSHFTFTVSLDQAAVEAITIPLALSGAADAADFVSVPENVTIGAGQTTAGVTLTTVADSAVEGIEGFSLELGAGPNYGLGDATTASGAILDDDGPPLATIALVSATGQNEGSATGTGAQYTFRVSLSRAVTQSTTISLTRTGAADAADFDAAPTSVTIAAGQTFADVTFRARPDSTIEPDEAFTVALVDNALIDLGATPSASATIVNDDVAPPVVTITRTSAESQLEFGATFSFRISLSSAATNTITVPLQYGGQASSLDFYNRPFAVTFAAGQTYVDLWLNVVDDNIVESSESFSVTLLTNAGFTLGSPNSAGGRILNDDSHGGGGGGGQFPPIVLDLTDLGSIELTPVTLSKHFDVDANGEADAVGWIDARQGFLVLDRNGDGRMQAEDIAFVQDLPGAQSDLEGLAAYDTNNDRLFDALDARWGDFRIWQDVNSNQFADPGELKNLGDWGITGVRLDGVRTGVTPPNSGQSGVFATSTFIRSDGSEGLLGDVFLGVDTRAGDNVIIGSSGADSIFARSGADRVFGGDGADVIEGGDGADFIDGGLGVDTLLGGDGNDTLIVQAGGASFAAGDVADGGAGDDVYVFSQNEQHAVVIDGLGENQIVLNGVEPDMLWLTRDGDDLDLGVIGGSTRIKVRDHFLNPAAMAQLTLIGAAERTLRLPQAGELIEAMSAISLAPPASLSPIVQANLAAIYNPLFGIVPEAAQAAETNTAPAGIDIWYPDYSQSVVSMAQVPVGAPVLLRKSSPAAGQTIVARVAPVDPDTQAENRRYAYALTGPDAAMFSINSAGEIRLQKTIPAARAAHYQVVVESWDGGELGLGAKVTRSLDISPVNELPKLQLERSFFRHLDPGDDHLSAKNVLTAVDQENDPIVGMEFYTISGYETLFRQLINGTWDGHDHTYLQVDQISGSPQSRQLWFFEGEYFNWRSSPESRQVGIRVIERANNETRVIDQVMTYRWVNTFVEATFTKATLIERRPNFTVMSVLSGSPRRVSITVSDPDGDDLSYQLVSVTSPGMTDGRWLNNNNVDGEIRITNASNTGLELQFHNWAGSTTVDQYVGVQVTETSNGVSNAHVRVFKFRQNAWTSSGVGFQAPLVFDLADKGSITFNPLSESVADFDVNSNGALDRVGWTTPDHGFLVLDRNGDGLVQASDISFMGDFPGAQSDLEGLTAHDSNADQVFDAGDERFGEFQIWRDANDNKQTDAGELRALSDWGIVGIRLNGRRTGATVESAADSFVYATTDFIRDDGSLGLVGDVFVAYQPGEIEFEEVGQYSVELPPPPGFFEPSISVGEAQQTAPNPAEPVTEVDELTFADALDEQPRVDIAAALGAGDDGGDELLEQSYSGATQSALDRALADTLRLGAMLREIQAANNASGGLTNLQTLHDPYTVKNPLLTAVSTQPSVGP